MSVLEDMDEMKSDGTDLKEERLYHYTTASGLLGILEKKRIWASEIRFLNDMREFSEALDLIKTLNGTILADQQNRSAMVVNDRIQTILALPRHIVTGIFVTSFSEEGNQLGQWRGYCPQGGFSIGFNAEYLKRTLKLKRCIYDRTEQQGYLKRRLLPVLKKTYAALPSDLPQNITIAELEEIALKYDDAFGKLIDALKRVAPIIKHEKFVQEREWRAVRPFKIEGTRVKFRAGKYQPIPYVELSIDIGRIEQIVVGPTPEPDIAVNSIRTLLRHHRLNCDEIVVDVVPIRPWW